MKFHEAAPLMKVGDKFKPYDGEWGEFLAVKGSDGLRFQVEGTGVKYVYLSSSHFNLEGEIIRATPKVKSTDEILNDFKSSHNGYYCNSQMYEAIKRGHQNGRLERDLEWHKTLKEILIEYTAKKILGEYKTPNAEYFFDWLKNNLPKLEQK